MPPVRRRSAGRHGGQIGIGLVGTWRGRTLFGDLAAFLAMPPVDRAERAVEQPSPRNSQATARRARTTPRGDDAPVRCCTATSRWRCMRCLNAEFGTTSLHAVLADHHISQSLFAIGRLCSRWRCRTQRMSLGWPKTTRRRERPHAQRPPDPEPLGFKSPDPRLSAARCPISRSDRSASSPMAEAPAGAGA